MRFFTALSAVALISLVSSGSAKAGQYGFVYVNLLTADPATGEVTPVKVREAIKDVETAEYRSWSSLKFFPTTAKTIVTASGTRITIKWTRGHLANQFADQVLKDGLSLDITVCARFSVDPKPIVDRAGVTYTKNDVTFDCDWTDPAVLERDFDSKHGSEYRKVSFQTEGLRVVQKHVPPKPETRRREAP